MSKADRRPWRQTPESETCKTIFGNSLMAANTDGTIRRLTDKGFGFIAAADGTEYFFHQSAIQGARYDELREGQRVTFSIGQGPKGPRAENVRPA
jgi:CspA family cold shock protein